MKRTEKALRRLLAIKGEYTALRAEIARRKKEKKTLGIKENLAIEEIRGTMAIKANIEISLPEKKTRKEREEKELKRCIRAAWILRDQLRTGTQVIASCLRPSKYLSHILSLTHPKKATSGSPFASTKLCRRGIVSTLPHAADIQGYRMIDELSDEYNVTKRSVENWLYCGIRGLQVLSTRSAPPTYIFGMNHFFCSLG